MIKLNYNIGLGYVDVLAGLEGRTMQSPVVGFTASVVEPLYLWLDEGFSSARFSEALLARYKEKCELFNRGKLHAAYTEATSIGETVLKRHLWEYLHDRGIDVYVEPQTASGEVDMVSTQNSEDPMIIDAKIFNGQNLRSVASGFRQVYHYLCDLSKPYGYLIIYKTTTDELHVSLQEAARTIQFIIHNNKTIFAMVIDVAMYSVPASKRGKIKRHELETPMIIEAIKDDEIQDVT